MNSLSTAESTRKMSGTHVIALELEGKKTPPAGNRGLTLNRSELDRRAAMQSTPILPATREKAASWASFESDSDLSPFHLDAWPDAYTYLVHWDTPFGPIVKVGISGSPSRWRRFVRRGGSVDLIVRSRLSECLTLERNVHSVLDGIFYGAFHSKADSLPYLGDGSGWTECYRAAPDFARSVVEGEMRR